MNFNKVLLGGHLTRDPEMRYTPKGTAIAAFGLAVNRTWKNEAGETKEEVTFVDLTCFGRTAEEGFQFLGGKKDGASAPAPRENRANATNAPDTAPTPPPVEDDVPF